MRCHTLGFTLLRLSPRLAALNCFFLATAVIQAQAPVIVLPSDPDLVGANESFDTAVWSREALMTTPRIDFAMSAVDGIIYAAGGRVFTITGPVNILEAYDPDTKVWTTRAPMPTARFNTGAGTIADGTINARMYVVGGQRADLSITDRVDAYNPSAGPNGTWTTRTKMPTPRWGIGVAVLGGILYAIGGADSTGVVGTVEAYDPSVGPGGTWTTKTSMNVARRNTVVGAVDGKIYAIGGADDDGMGLTAVEEFDPAGAGGAGSWSTKTDIPILQLGAAGGVIGGKIYVVGGIEGSVTQTALSLVQAYDPATDTWSTEAAMPTARLNHRVAVLDDTTLYAIGGRYYGVARVGEPFLYKIVATNQPTDYEATNLPDGLSIDNGLGLIFGTPNDPPSEPTVTLTASNGDGIDSRDIRLAVLPSIPSAMVPSASEPAVKSSSSVTGRIGASFSFQVLVESATENTDLDAGGTLPLGLTLDPVTGLIAGVIDASEDTDGDGLVTYHVVLTLKDSVLTTSTETGLQLHFTSDSATPVITSAETVTLVPNKFFTYIVAADADASFSYIGTDGVENGLLPPGLSFDPETGTISGIYTGGSAASRASEIQSAPDTIKIRPPAVGIVNLIGESSSGAPPGTRPLNFFEPIAVSQLTHGSAGAFDIPLPLQDAPGAPGIECRDGRGTYHVIVTFPTPVTHIDDVTVVGAAVIQSRSISADGTEVTINLKNALDQQTITVNLLGVTVDDGARTYDVSVPMGLLVGDTIPDGVVQNADVSLTRSQIGTTLTTSNCPEDVDVNGQISNRDVSLVKSKRGHHLP